MLDARKSRQSRQRQKIKGFLTTEDKEGTERKAGKLLRWCILRLATLFIYWLGN